MFPFIFRILSAACFLSLNSVLAMESGSALPLTDAPLFTQIQAGPSGVTMRHPLLPDHPRAYLYYSGFACGSVSIGDVNGDGRPDLFFTSGPEKNRLYLQTEAAFKFREATDEAGLSGVTSDGEVPWAAGATMVDLNHDEHLDIYVCNYDAPNQLFINDGTGRFTEQAREWGLDIQDASLFPAFMDIDGSGELALYLLCNRYERPGGRPEEPPVVFVNGVPRITPEFEKYYGLKQTGPTSYAVDFAGRPDRLLIVQRDETGRRYYRDVSREAGILPEGGHGLSATWFDYDGDGRPDLYVCNDFEDTDWFYRNEGKGPDGIVRFKNVIADAMPVITWASMGADAADINNDGLLDFLAADMAATTHFKAKISMGDMSSRLNTLLHSWPRQTMRNMLFLNTGTGRFLESAYLSGVAKTDWTWAVKLADFDNDSWVDLFTANGASRNYTDSDLPFATEMYIGNTDWDLLRNQPPLKEENLAFRNVDGLRFENVSKAWGLNHFGMSYAAAYGDLDGDGDLDLVVCNLDEPVSVYRNEGAEGRHWLKVRLQGRASHTQGWGALVRVKTASGWRIRPMNPATGFLSCNEPILHFGLGTDTEVEAVEVRWPSGRRQWLEKIPANQLLVLTEPDTDNPGAKEEPPPSPPLFVADESSGLNFRHQEMPYDDFEREFLLPAKLSQLGPGIAVGDPNGDGHDDVYFGGAAGQAGALFVNGGDGRFTRVTGPWEADAASEDMGMLWFDADGDGRLDLYVVSGGVECSEDDPILQDRLYLNETPTNGPVTFRRADERSLPVARHAGSVVCAADFDDDGDLDLFVGSRSIPGRYPQTPRSMLMRNESLPGRPGFVEVTDEVAPGLAEAGLITGAIWSDVDGDGRPDLLVVSEWGPVKLFRNDQGRLIALDAPVAAPNPQLSSLHSLTGWWNGIAAGDFDGDGKIDYLVSNVGLNTKYGDPGPGHPSLLYAGDMEGSGSCQLVEAKTGDEGILPVRGRSCSSTAMPFLKEKFPTYRAFASAVLPEIYGQATLNEALRMEAAEFRSGILLNRSTPARPGFEWRPLPDIAQISPSYGIAVADFDGDGQTDAVLAQNLFTREPETGLWRGGLNQLLRGHSGKNIEAVPARESGIVIPGDAKGAATVDLNGDARPDLLVAQNDDEAVVLRNQSGAPWLCLRLAGPMRNPGAIGAHVTVHFADGRVRANEVCAGSGYLSQSSPEIYIGLGEGLPVRAEIRWPSGMVQTVDLKDRTGRVIVEPAER